MTKKTTPPTFNVEVEFYLCVLDSSARNKESDTDAMFKMYIKWLGKKYFISTLKLSICRALIGSGIEYNTMVSQARGEGLPDDGMPPVIAKAIPHTDFIAWAKKYEQSSAYKTFQNL